MLPELRRRPLSRPRSRPTTYRGGWRRLSLQPSSKRLVRLVTSLPSLPRKPPKRRKFGWRRRRPREKRCSTRHRGTCPLCGPLFAPREPLPHRGVRGSRRSTRRVVQQRLQQPVSLVSRAPPPHSGPAPRPLLLLLRPSPPPRRGLHERRQHRRRRRQRCRPQRRRVAVRPDSLSSSRCQRLHSLLLLLLLLLLVQLPALLLLPKRPV
mmetsp:Transcript_103691/g.297870  ORF Transcript_103691/g.297870 Transcript_103691/m.297870 type:complete len:208 (+) Transcript_103691:1626-2249(+)